VAVGDVLLDRYRLVALIGEGGMSRVFKATDLGRRPGVTGCLHCGQVLTRPINEDFGSLPRFEGSSKAPGSHASEYRAYFDCDRDGSIVFITMEYLAGPSLYTKLAAARRPESRPGIGRREAST